jgi:amidase
MARNVGDVALLLDAMVGEHPADPLSLPKPVRSFRDAVQAGWRPKRVAYSADLGITPVDVEVERVTRAAARRFEDAGIIVEEAHPDLSEAHDCFRVLRAFDFVISKAVHLRNDRALLKPELADNIERGMALTIEEIERAEAQRITLAARMLTFLQSYDLLLTPTTIVAPFPVEQRYVGQCAGHKFGNYVEWLAIAYAVTLCCCPALSLPCGFTREELPVGLQIVAPPRAEARLLAAAKLLEDILDVRPMAPILPRVPSANMAAASR